MAGWYLLMPSAGLAECPDDIVAYWKLDETSGPTYVDFVGGHDGTGNADPTAVPSGQVAGAQLFGTGLGIDVPPAKAFNWGPTDSFSIELWVKTDVTPAGNKVMIGRGAAGGGNVFWWVGIDNAGKPAFLVRERGGSFRKLVGETVISDGAWHHIVATRNGETDEHSLYVDGAMETVTFTFDGVIDLGFATTEEVNIGYVDDAFYYTGLIDEVALYDRVLTEGEIQGHVNSGTDYCGGAAAPVTSFVPFPEETVALWPLDEAGGSTYVDAFGNNDGTGNADPTAVPSGQVAGAQLFGTGLGIDVPPAKAFNWGPTDSFSIELWVKTDVTAAGNKVMIGRGAAGGGNVFWWVGLITPASRPSWCASGVAPFGNWSGRPSFPTVRGITSWPRETGRPTSTAFTSTARWRP